MRKQAMQTGSKTELRAPGLVEAREYSIGYPCWRRGRTETGAGVGEGRQAPSTSPTPSPRSMLWAAVVSSGTGGDAGPCCRSACALAHREIWIYYPSTSKAHVQVPQNLTVRHPVSALHSCVPLYHVEAPVCQSHSCLNSGLSIERLHDVCLTT